MVRSLNALAMACLSSRIPYGSPVTIEVLDEVEQAELFLHSLGIRQLRVRHHGDTARIELDEGGMVVLMSGGRRSAVVERFKQLGFLYVTLDLAGFRSGSMNDVLKQQPSSQTGRLPQSPAAVERD